MVIISRRLETLLVKSTDPSIEYFFEYVGKVRSSASVLALLPYRS